MKVMILVLLFLLFSLCIAPLCIAHTPFMACFDNGDGTITCNGEFSDGSSASGVSIQVVDGRRRVLVKGNMDPDGEFTFGRPEGDFSVIFDAGPGHVVIEKSDNIIE